MIPDTARFLTYLERRREVLLSCGDPRPLHRDLELHLLSIGVEQDAATKSLLKDGLSALALYMVSRPRFETFGWTISLQDPPLNLFFTGSASEGKVVGRAFRDHIQAAPKNKFYAQTSRPFGEIQTSSVDVDGGDVFCIVEQYCSKSDQQPVRVFRGDDGRVALLSSLPETDRGWLRAVTRDEAFGLEKTGDVKLMTEHEVSFHCGCDTQRITRIVADLYKDDAEDLFRGEASVEAECPRCGTKHLVTREGFERAKT